MENEIKMKDYKVSIIMLTYNAPAYVKLAVESLKALTQNINYELIVVDNHSGWRTRLLIKWLQHKKKIDIVQMNKKNLLFAKGNNVGSRIASPDATHYLLINSDVEIRDKNWLKYLCQISPEGGICAYGLVEDEPVRADGYCMLVDSAFYRAHQLDENYEWFWSVTKLQAEALKEGRRVVAVKEHDDLIYHFGGKSGKGFRKAKGMDEDRQKIIGWFEKKQIEIVERIDGGDK